jgi:uncharacterized membrane protein YhaH (DUF805 family)
MDFGQSISAGFRNYFNFKDRASRSEYWWFQLFNVLFLSCCVILDAILIVSSSRGPHFVPFTILGYLFLIIPNLSLYVRRMHDTDHSGWMLLVPVMSLILPFFKGNNGHNYYGPDPLSYRYDRYGDTGVAAPRAIGRTPNDRFNGSGSGLSLVFNLNGRPRKIGLDTLARSQAAKVGRATGCRVVLDDASVSREHAEIKLDPQSGLMIRDLGSSNGTSVDGKRVGTNFVTVTKGSKLRMGKVDILIAD